jgi:hypothetical protein
MDSNPECCRSAYHIGNLENNEMSSLIITETASECVCGGALIKKKIKFSSYIGKFRMEQ